MEGLFEIIVEKGYEFSLTYIDGLYGMAVSRPEWITHDLYQSRALPQWKNKDMRVVVSEAVAYCLS